jgi:Rrf2 family protein
MISKKTKYGLKALLYLAKHFDVKAPVLISKLAEEEKIPRKFLELILLELKNAGMLQSKMGKGGGYFLAKAPAQIDLGNVLRVLDGPLAPLPCLSLTAYRRCEECADEASCAIRLSMKEVRDATVRHLEQTSLQDMLDQQKHTKNIPMYAI